jgi:hypothetical protein
LSLTNPKSEMARGTEALATLLDGTHARRTGREPAPAPNGLPEQAVEPA